VARRFPRAALARCARLGFDDDFIRLWEFYLAYCEGGFRERSIGVAHLKFAKAGLPDKAHLPDKARVLPR
jgi:cyclopropane-fatty-acyl-phospholipid synthase